MEPFEEMNMENETLKQQDATWWNLYVDRACRDVTVETFGGVNGEEIRGNFEELAAAVSTRMQLRMALENGETIIQAERKVRREMVEEMKEMVQSLCQRVHQAHHEGEPVGCQQGVCDDLNNPRFAELLEK